MKKLHEFLVQSPMDTAEDLLICADYCEECGYPYLAACWRYFVGQADNERSKQAKVCQFAWQDIVKTSTLDITEDMASTLFGEKVTGGFYSAQKRYHKYLANHN